MHELDQSYEILGLKPGATEQEVVQAYKILLKALDPARFPNDTDMRRLSSEKLKDVDKAFKTLMASIPSHDALPKQTVETKLRIKSDPPQATVFVNGKEVGKSPLAFSRVPLGKYHVRIVCEGYEPYEVNAEIKTGDVKVIDVPLKKLALEGGIVVRTEPPGAEIYIDGQALGVTPFQRGNLLQSTYNIRIIREGYEIWENSVTIQAGRIQEISIKLEPRKPKSGDVWKDPHFGMEFVFVKGGTFEMGDVFGDGDHDERPVHEIHVDDFFIGKCEVTKDQWAKIMGDDSFSKGFGDCPVENVNFENVQAYIRQLNKRPGMNYRLPTEAEWEYAARSCGRKEKWAGTSIEEELPEYAWFVRNSGRVIHRVAEKRPNRLGLYDMSGNVLEWVSDYYRENYYKESPKNNPQGPTWGEGERRVLRGGDCTHLTNKVRTSTRFARHPRALITSFEANTGFRLVLPAKDVPVKEVMPQSRPIPQSSQNGIYGTPLRGKENAEKGQETNHLDRVLCSNGDCVGVINEKGVCGICGKPKGKESEYAIEQNLSQKMSGSSRAFSWKSFGIAILITSIIAGFIAAASPGSKPRGLHWTLMWMILTVEGWKYWKWKSLLPYLAYLLCTSLGSAIVGGAGGGMSGARTINVAVNVVGVTIFAIVYLHRTRKKG